MNDYKEIEQTIANLFSYNYYKKAKKIIIITLLIMVSILFVVFIMMDNLKNHGFTDIELIIKDFLSLNDCDYLKYEVVFSTLDTIEFPESYQVEIIYEWLNMYK